ncbi:MAG TPA: PAS domain S-box protein [Ohtaekwangia sp.]|nr:PAS domain S-box protein [Ohtaekwangia sp.]
MKPSGRFKDHELNDKRFRALIQNAHEGVVQYDIDGRIVFASKSIHRVCGFGEKEVLGKLGVDFVHPDDKAEASATFRELLKVPGARKTLIQRIKHKKGHYIWSESSLTNFSHVAEINGIVSNFRDITEKKLAEERIFQTQELLETATRNLTEGIFMGVINSRFIYVNDAFLKLLGYKSLREIKNVKPSSLYADLRQRKLLLGLLQKGKPIRDVEILFKRKDGTTFWVVMNGRLLTHEGKADYFVGTIRDTSKEREAARELVESGKFLNNIIDTVAAPIFVKDSRHRWIMFNKKFAEFAGRPREQLLGKTDKDVVPASEAEIFWEIDDQVLRTGKTIFNEEKITLNSGMVHYLLTIKSRYINEKGEKFVIGFITDITHLRNTEEKIFQLNANLKGVIESTKESVYAVDRNFNYLIFNQNHKRTMKALYGADIREGENKLKYLQGSPDLKWVKQELERAISGKHFVSEHHLDYPRFKGYIQTAFNPIYGQNGEIRGAAVFVTNITERKQFEDIIHSMNANLSAVMESTADRILAIDRNFRYISFNKAQADAMKNLVKRPIKTGDNFLAILPPQAAQIARTNIERAFKGQQFIEETHFPSGVSIEAVYNPIRNAQNEVTGAALFVRDISERKRIETELKRLNNELVNQNNQLAAQEEKLKAALEELSERNFELDQLMYKTSHDLRSPLSSIMGLVNLARLDRDSENRDHYLSKIEDRIKKLDEFIRSMLDYARVNRVEISYETVDLVAIAEGCVKELEYLENFGAVKISIKAAGNPCIITDPLRIRIIFSNIISNAYKYYNPEVTSYLRVRIVVHDRFSEITFSDNGIGIKKEHIAKVFNMFYRATDRSQGSGLGMYIVQQAVHKLKGEIRVKSEYGTGTKITIRLPADPC